MFKALTVAAGKPQVEAAPEVKFRAPAEVKAKVPEVTVERVRLLLVVLTVEAPNPVAEIAPEVAVRFNAPVVRVKPLEAVRVWENLPVPVTSKAAAGAVVPIPILPPGIKAKSTPEAVTILFGPVPVKVIVVIPESAPAVVTFKPVEVKLNEPALRVKPFEAVRVDENEPVPVTSRVAPGKVLPMPTLPCDI
jgi:hypothetical protein